MKSQAQTISKTKINETHGPKVFVVGKLQGIIRLLLKSVNISKFFYIFIVLKYFLFLQLKMDLKKIRLFKKILKNIYKGKLL